jgi:ribosomal protein L3 glutamine methyltransferase
MTAIHNLNAASNAGELILAVEAVLGNADLYYGHGTASPRDEAAALVFHVLALDHAAGADAYGACPTADQSAEVARILDARVATRSPLPYLLGEAWFAGLPFCVDPRVLIPRSPIAELIAEHFEPWIDSSKVARILEIGTGSGCIAIACALAFPGARVTATDISPDALAVAEVNRSRHAVVDRLTLVETDHAAGVSGPFEIIVTNPPYVPDGEMMELPAEYAHEPELGLVSGSDGLDSARRILQDAATLLAPGGILVLEVGAQWQELDRAFPELPLTWLEFEYGGEGVALIYQQDLVKASA